MNGHQKLHQGAALVLRRISPKSHLLLQNGYWGKGDLPLDQRQDEGRSGKLGGAVRAKNVVTEFDVDRHSSAKMWGLSHFSGRQRDLLVMANQLLSIARRGSGAGKVPVEILEEAGSLGQ